MRYRRPRIAHVGWYRSSGGLESSGGRTFKWKSARTKRVNQKIILDFVDISKARLTRQEGSNSCGNVQEVHLLTGQTDVAELFQYVVSSGIGFSKMEAMRGGGGCYRSAAS